MVGFGKRIKRKAPKGWESLMLDYSLLKSRLEMASEVESLDGSQHGRTDSKVALALRNSFQHLLDSELEKVLAHYSLYSARLCSRVEGLKAETSVASQFLRQGLGPSELAELTKDVKTLAELWVEQAGKLRMLLQYLTLNLEGLRKILKKYKKSNAVGVSPMPGLVTLRLDHPSLPGGFVEQGSFLPLDMVEQINAMKDHDELVEASQTVRAALLELDAMKRHLSEAAGRSGGRGRIVDLSIYGAFSQEARNHGSVQRSLTMLRSQLSSLEDLDAVERRARAAAAVITPVAHFETRAGIFTPAPPDHAAYATVPGLLINLASAFLYMANYSLVLPTNEEFLEHIGSRGSMAGVCVGMADITAVCVSLLYGWWSNRSFKQPLIASSLLCLTGNVVYCFAWDAHAGIALPMLLAGRLLTGMGSCRAVNRRYIADFVSSKRRTAASAAFVAASAGGAAMGPLLAVPLQNIQDFKIAGFSINSITGGGYLMAGAWLVFTTFLQTVFVDPPRDDDEDVSDDDSEDQAALESSPDVEDSLSRPLLGPATEDAQKPFDMRPAYCCILSLFVLKFVQQGMISSLPEFTHQFYGWRSAFIGGFLSALSLSMLPVNFGVALGATVISDRQLLLSSEVVSLLGCLLMLSYGGSFPAVWAYVTGTVLVYAATIVMESCSMSLLSKKIPKSLSRGTCNAGLLATQAGSGGRFFGNMSISFFGSLIGKHLNTPEAIVKFDHLMFGSLVAVTLIGFAFTLSIFRSLK